MRRFRLHRRRTSSRLPLIKGKVLRKQEMVEKVVRAFWREASPVIKEFGAIPLSMYVVGSFVKGEPKKHNFEEAIKAVRNIFPEYEEMEEVISLYEKCWPDEWNLECLEKYSKEIKGRSLFLAKAGMYSDIDGGLAFRVPPTMNREEVERKIFKWNGTKGFAINRRIYEEISKPYASTFSAEPEEWIDIDKNMICWGRKELRRSII